MISLQNRALLLQSLQNVPGPAAPAAPASVKSFVDQLQAELDNLIKRGKATLSGGSVTVPATWVTTNSRIVITPGPAVGVSGILDVENIMVGVSFDIKSTEGTDGRDVYWISVEQ